MHPPRLRWRGSSDTTLAPGKRLRYQPRSRHVPLSRRRGAPGARRQLAATGVVARTTTFDRESDYAAFTAAGIPSGGVWSGDRKNKNGKQARRWGGRAGEPFDPHYHTRRDRLDELNRTALDRFTRAAAGTVATSPCRSTAASSDPNQRVERRHASEDP